jgi:NAD(P)-dependent dehydrogenase (short-subunit alcohol dehydrogenase family)
MDLNGICAVVTGAGKGIGRATALALAAEGANVFSVARTEDDLLSLRDEASGLPGKITPFVADVTDEEKVHLLFEGVRKWIERFDLLVNAAGTGTFGPSDTYPVEEWRQTLEVNLTGAFICSREAVRLMKLYGGGTIINLSSIAGKRAFPQSAAYCASKWGVLGMSHSMAEELRGTGIRVTALCPGSTDTPFWQRMPFSPDPSRMMKPADVAAVIVEIARQPPSVTVDEMTILPPEGVL